MKGSPIVCVHPKMMTWIFLLQGLLLVFFTAEALDPEDFKITKFERAEVGITNVCVTTAPPEAKIYVLTTETAEFHYNKSEVLNNCISFAWDIASATGQTKIILKAKISLVDVIALDELTIDVPDFPTDFKGQLATGQAAPQYLLRCIGLLSWELEPLPTGTHVTANDIHYYLGASEKDTNFKLCLREQGVDKIDICDKEQEMNTVNILRTLTVKEATLQYESSTVKMTVESAGSVNKKIEVMISLNGSLTYALETPITTLDMELPVTGFISAGTIEFVIVGLNYFDNLKEYATHSFQDYELIGIPLTSTSFEVRWNHQNLESNYILLQEDSTGNTNLTVICNPINLPTITHCFGYFPDMPTTKQYVTVKLNTGDPSKDDVNMIKSLPITLAATKAGLQINLDWEQIGTKIHVKVCFTHTLHNVEKDFSHYESVIINNKNGKWFKQKWMTQDTEGELCFTNQTISKANFDITAGATLIVTQRAQDGLTVLASGETKLFTV